MAEPFQSGERASQAKLQSWLDELSTSDKACLEAINLAAKDTLVSLSRRLSAMNARRRRADHLLYPGSFLRFSVSDFMAIDQKLTTATVRADSLSATLEERTVSNETSVNKTSFSSSSLTVQQLDSAGSIFQVTGSKGVWGQFDIELSTAMELGNVVFDLAAPMSDPQISVQASDSGAVFTDATSVSLSGYRLVAWFPTISARYLRLRITPSQPDDISSSTYTFGLTDVSVSGATFSLASTLVTQASSFTPQSDQAMFLADSSGQINYFLTFYDGVNVVDKLPIVPGATFSLPGVLKVSSTGVAVNGSGLLAVTIPSDAYPSSIVVIQESNGKQVPLAPSLPTNDPRKASLASDVATLVGTSLSIVSPSLDTAKTYTVHYVHGPSSYSVRLQADLFTSDRGLSPIFRGAFLEYA